MRNITMPIAASSKLGPWSPSKPHSSSSSTFRSHRVTTTTSATWQRQQQRQQDDEDDKVDQAVSPSVASADTSSTASTSSPGGKKTFGESSSPNNNTKKASSAAFVKDKENQHKQKPSPLLQEDEEEESKAQKEDNDQPKDRPASTTNQARTTKVTVANTTAGALVSPQPLKQHQQEQEPVVDEMGPVGCYLVYEPSSGGRLMLQYSLGPVPTNAVGFWCCGAGHSIQGFKFRQAGGRSELIKGIAGGDANKRKYYAGWCQFLKLAKAKNGKVIAFRPALQGIAVDVYAYNQAHCAPYPLPLEDRLVSLADFDAVAVMAKNAVFLAGVKTIAVGNFLELGNLAGCSTVMTS